MKHTLIGLFTAMLFSATSWAAVNLNTASQAELETLDGVGPVKAQAIIDYRKKNGGFKSVNDLDNVPGFGDATMSKLKGEVSVSGKTTLAEPIVKDKPANSKASDTKAKTDKKSDAKDIKSKTEAVKADKADKVEKAVKSDKSTEKASKTEKAETSVKTKKESDKADSKSTKTKTEKSTAKSSETKTK